jgi:hydrogenase maturation protease
LAHLNAAQAGMIGIVCCGNPNRSDDGAGAHIHRLLRENGLHLRADIRLLDAGTDGLAVMFAARDCESLIVIDACLSRSEPGSVFELPGEEAMARPEPALSTHEFRWEHALFAGRQIFGASFPADITVLLIEAADLALGTELSPKVASAAGKVAIRIEELLRQKHAMAA